MFYKRLKTLHCQPCGRCLIPNDAIGHAQNKHGLDSKAVCPDEFADVCEELGVHQEAYLVVHPSPRSPPVEYTRSVTGVACTVDPANCAYCCTKPEVMDKHVREKHPSHPHPLSNCYRVGIQVQTLFLTFGVKYFEVEPALASVPKGSPLNYILQQFLPSLEPDPILPPDTERERTPFMRVVNWDSHMQDIRGDPGRRKLHKEFIAAPASDELASLLLGKVVLQYINLGIELGWGHRQHLTIWKHLAQGEHILAYL